VEFLTSITAAEALRLLASFPLAPPHLEEVPLEAASSRVLASDIVARENIPPFHRSLVDGYAVKAKDTYGAREGTPAFLNIIGEVPVGRAAHVRLTDGQAAYVATGAMIPESADAVVMDEYARRAAEAVEITRAVRKAENICFEGEDVKIGETVLEKGRLISPFDLGVLAALGLITVTVCRRPECGLISSGNEVVPADATPGPGKIRDINTHTVADLVKRRGCLVRFAGIARDTVDAVAEKLLSVKGCDVILLSGGSSKGASDHMTAAIERLGGRILFHGLNIRPGKPTLFASLWGSGVFGLPGHPVSCAMVVLRFVLPFLERLKGEKTPGVKWIVKGLLTTNIPSAYGIEEYVRVNVSIKEDLASVTPIFAKSAVISTLSRAEGYVVVPEGKEGLETGEEVEVLPLG
jgi:molybdopterin molybdotransferase